MTFNCIDCGVSVGTVKDRNVPVRCDPCIAKKKGEKK